MSKRDSSPTTPSEPRGALLRLGAPPPIRFRRLPPGPALAPYVRHHWFIDWDLREPVTQHVLTEPAVNLVAEATMLSAGGMGAGRFDRTLAGRGSVYGVLFLPAGFWPFWRRPLHTLHDTSVELGERLGLPGGALHAELAGLPDDDARVARLEGLLLDLQPQLYPELRELNRLVALARAEPGLNTAEALAERAGWTLRTLQRRLREHVGVGPKALLRRCRLQEAAARLAEGEAVNLSELALRLGYGDQAHFSRDFRAVVGRSPGAYAAGARSAGSARP